MLRHVGFDDGLDTLGRPARRQCRVNAQSPQTVDAGRKSLHLAAEDPTVPAPVSALPTEPISLSNSVTSPCSAPPARIAQQFRLDPGRGCVNNAQLWRCNASCRNAVVLTRYADGHEGSCIGLQGRRCRPDRLRACRGGLWPSHADRIRCGA